MKKTFIPLTALALLALVSCGGTDNSSSQGSSSSSSQGSSSSSSQGSSSSSVQDVVNSIAITNKEELQAEWAVGSADRTINIEIDPIGNINALISEGKIKITSSDSAVAAVVGRVLQAKAAGSATITVTYGDKTDSVDVVIIAEKTAIDLYGTVHAGTLADPLDNADAIKVAETVGTTATEKYFYVKGVVDSFRDAPSSYGNVSYYIKKGDSDTKSFLVYRATLDNDIFGRTKVTEDDIWVGAEVIAKVKIMNYNNTVPETESGGSIVSITGTKPDIKTIEVTVAEALAAAKALADNTTSTDKYVITGYIVGTDSKGFYLSDTKGEITPTKDDFLVYGYSGDNKSECTLNAKVKVTAYLQHYVSTSQADTYNYQTTSISSVEILEKGDEPVVTEEITFAKAIETINALEDGATTTKQYIVTGYVIKIESAYSATYKNMSFTLGETADATTNLITVFRTSLASGTSSDSVVAGAKVKVTCYLQKYVKDGVTTPEAVKGSTELFKEGGGSADLTVTDATVEQAASATGGLKGKTLYRIKGVIESMKGDKYGNAYLTDPTSGKSVRIYGLTGTDDNKVFDTTAASDNKFFVNPQDALTSLADVKNGDEVTVRVAWYTFNSQPQIFGVLEEHAASEKTYGVNIATLENGEVSADKTAYSYGETVTLTATPASGYQVKSVSVKDAAGSGITTAMVDATTYTFAATCVNNVTVIFEAIPTGTTKTVTWDCSSGAGAAEASATESEFSTTIGTQTVTMGCVNVQANAGYMFLKSDKGSAYVYSKEALPGSIQSITIKTGSGASPKALYSVVVGEAALSKQTTTVGTNVAAGAEYTFTFDSTGCNYFQIANTGSTKNSQVASVTIVYDTAK